MSTSQKPLSCPLKTISDIQNSNNVSDDNSLYMAGKIRYSKILKEYHKCLRKRGQDRGICEKAYLSIKRL